MPDRTEQNVDSRSIPVRSKRGAPSVYWVELVALNSMCLLHVVHWSFADTQVWLALRNRRTSSMGLRMYSSGLLLFNDNPGVDEVLSILVYDT